MYHITIRTACGTLSLPLFSCRADAIRMASYLALALRGRVSITYNPED